MSEPDIDEVMEMSYKSYFAALDASVATRELTKEQGLFIKDTLRLLVTCALGAAPQTYFDKREEIAKAHAQVRLGLFIEKNTLFRGEIAGLRETLADAEDIVNTLVDYEELNPGTYT